LLCPSHCGAVGEELELLSRPQALGDTAAPFHEALDTTVSAEVNSSLLLLCCLHLKSYEIILE